MMVLVLYYVAPPVVCGWLAWRNGHRVREGVLAGVLLSFFVVGVSATLLMALLLAEVIE